MQTINSPDFNNLEDGAYFFDGSSVTNGCGITNGFIVQKTYTISTYKNVYQFLLSSGNGLYTRRCWYNTWGDWESKLSSSDLEKSGTITLSQACTLLAGSTTVRTVGKMCFFSIIIVVKGNGQTTPIGVATLPSGFAPSVDFAIACPVWGDSSKEHAVCQFYKGDRNLYLYAQSDTQRTYAITGSYMTA